MHLFLPETTCLTNDQGYGNDLVIESLFIHCLSAHQTVREREIGTRAVLKVLSHLRSDNTPTAAIAASACYVR